MSFEDQTDAKCFHCGERVELYAPGESYTVLDEYPRQPMHVQCARIVEAQEKETGFPLMLSAPELKEGQSRDDECSTCFHPRGTHDNKYGCVHEHDTEKNEILMAVQCSCQGFTTVRCKNCGAEYTETMDQTCRYVERDAGNPHGNNVVTEHEWVDVPENGVGSVVFAVGALKMVREELAS